MLLGRTYCIKGCKNPAFLRPTDPQEAERKVNGRIELLQKRHGRQELIIIVGKGSHSEDGVSRLQPAIMSALEKSQGRTSRCFPREPNDRYDIIYQMLMKGRPLELSAFSGMP